MALPLKVVRRGTLGGTHPVHSFSTQQAENNVQELALAADHLSHKQLLYKLCQWPYHEPGQVERLLRVVFPVQAFWYLSVLLKPTHT